MKRHWFVRMVAALLAAQASCCVTVPAQIRITAKSGVTVILDAPKRTYEITVARLPWKFRGEIVGNVTGAKKVRGRDRLGSYSAISFTSTDGIRYLRTIRIYDNRPAIVFQQTSGDPLRRAPNPFPVLTVHPARCSMLTFSEREFGAPPLFRAFNEPPDSSHGLHSGPLLLYDSTGSACIFSPASNFMVASIEENGSTIRSGLTRSLQSVPRGFSEST
ncbi:MAG TPA: hypothetical protein VI758_07305, partial [Bacteroidota bacterium]